MKCSLDVSNFLEELSAAAAAAAAKLLQLCPTLCDPIDGSPPGSPVPGILQARSWAWHPSRNTGPWPQSWAAGARDLNYCVYWASAIQHEFVLSSFSVFFFFFRHGVQDVVSCFPNQGSSPGPLHWKHLLGSPLSAFSILVNLHKNPDIGTDILLLLFSCKVVSDSL